MRLLMRVVTVVALVVDAYVHLRLASTFDGLKGSGISQGGLFRVEAGVSIAAAILVLVVATRVTYAISFLVAASAVGALLLYRYVDVGSLGPLPNMYYPAWTGGKVLSGIAEAVGALSSLVGFVLVRGRTRTHR